MIEIKTNSFVRDISERIYSPLKTNAKIKTMLFKTITVSTQIDENVEETITSTLMDYGIKIHSIDYKKNLSAGELIFNFLI